MGAIAEDARRASLRTGALLAELRALIARHARPDETTAIDGALLSVAGRPGEPRASTTGTVMAIIAQGEKRLAIGDRVYDYGPGQYLVASVDLPITGHYTHAAADEPALGFGLVLRPSAIASLVLDADAAPASPPPRRARSAPAPPGLGVAEASPELLDAVVRMVRLLDSPGDRDVLAPMIEREIVWRLINGPLGESVRQIGVADSSLTHVSRAVRWITEHYNKPFRVEDLARACGMSTSAFHRNFHAITALSPIQFQKQIRLQKSRLLLLTGADDVATVGYRVGYDSTSQFSREYRRQFGLPPGRDADRLRAGPGTV
ncbi:MAG: AraC family transcriptional regulator [Actinobacteria bacterium]|nr:MAG: AraC family transcriptional regulator [Actinomycetota bacterium]